MALKDKIRPRGDTAANWTSANPVLSVREIAIETDTNKFKVGDGSTAWNSLPYANKTTNASELTSGTLNPARLSFTKEELDTAVSNGNVMYVGDAPTAHNHSASELTSGTLPDARLSAKVKSLADLATPASTQLLAMNSSGLVVDGSSFAEVEVASVSALSTTVVANGKTVLLKGYYTTGDGGGQTLYYDSSSTATVNGGTVFNGPGGVGRFLSLNTDEINVKMFGARGDGSSNDTARIQAALSSGASQIIVTESTAFYRIESELVVPDGVSVRGGGQLKQVTPNTNGLSLGNDCVIDGVRITGLHTLGNASSSDVANGVFVSGKRNVTVRNCEIDGWMTGGVQCRDCFNVDISHNLFWGSTWDFSNPTSGVGADIMVYSIVDGARTIIVGNRCMSNNSQGIGFSSSGQDSACTIANNICTPLENWALPAIGTGVGGAGLLNRRHGIVASYGGSSNSGKMTVTGNICEHTLVTGIYVAAAALQTGIIVANNVCRDNGYATASDSTLAGSISCNGPGTGVLIQGNVIESFRGISSTGAIHINDTTATGSYVVRGNTIRGSTANGIKINQDVLSVVIEGNEIRECDLIDIAVLVNANFSGRILNNETYRLNTNRESLVVETPSTNEIVIDGNKFSGAGTTAGANNSGIRVNNTTVNRIRLRRNLVQNFNRGIYFAALIETRELSRLKIEDNDLIGCETGVLLFSGTGTGMVATGPTPNRFRNCTTRYGDSYGWNACVEGPVKAETRVEIEGTSAPTSGQPATQSWVRGDRVINSLPAVGQPKSWVCTVSGTPGTWVSEGNL